MNYQKINVKKDYPADFILFNYNRYLSLYQQRNDFSEDYKKKQFLYNNVERLGKMLIQLNALSVVQHKYNKKMKSFNYN